MNLTSDALRHLFAIASGEALVFDPEILNELETLLGLIVPIEGGRRYALTSKGVAQLELGMSSFGEWGTQPGEEEE